VRCGVDDEHSQFLVPEQLIESIGLWPLERPAGEDADPSAVRQAVVCGGLVLEQWGERLDLTLIARQSRGFALSPEDGVERRGAHTAIWTFCASHPCGVSFTGRGAAGTTAGAGLPVEAGGFGKSSPKTSPQ